MAIKYIVQHRYGSTEDWEKVADTIIPLEGELTVEIGPNKQHRLKIGDGQSTYRQLKYLSVDDFIITKTMEKHITVKLSKDGWTTDEENPTRHWQRVHIEGATSASKLDLQPTLNQLCIFYEKDIAFTTTTETIDDEVVIKVWAIGDKPETNDYFIQATITEVLIDA